MSYQPAVCSRPGSINTKVISQNAGGTTVDSGSSTTGIITAIPKINTFEFEQMWGSHTDVPSPVKAKCGTEKTDNVLHIFENKYLMYDRNIK